MPLWKKPQSTYAYLNNYNLVKNPLFLMLRKIPKARRPFPKNGRHILDAESSACQSDRVFIVGSSLTARRSKKSATNQLRNLRRPEIFSDSCITPPKPKDLVKALAPPNNKSGPISRPQEEIMPQKRHLCKPPACGLVFFYHLPSITNSKTAVL